MPSILSARPQSFHMRAVQARRTAVSTAPAPMAAMARPQALPLGRPQNQLRLRASGLLPLRNSERRSRGSLCVSASGMPGSSPALSSVDYVEQVEVLLGGGDEFKEQDRKMLRTVYDFNAWKRHRSSGRYWRHISHTFKSRTVRWMAGPLLYVMSVALGVALYHTAADAGYLPEVIPELKLATSAPFSLTSFALSLLLVFRTNTSYQRWDEARKMWGLIVNRSRDITRQALGYIPASQPELQDMFCRWMAAYPKALMCHLREYDDLETELTGKLKPEELKALLASNHRPNYCMQVLTEVLKKAQLGPLGFDASINRDPAWNVKASAAFRMDENLTQFSDTTGGCERILRTPVPLAWTRHNSRFLIIWLTLMPFTLWDSCHWYTLPVTGLVSFLLLGIKEIGVTIEEPFSILPLEVISNTIETNIWELHRTHGARSILAAEADMAASNQIDATALVNAVVPAAAPLRSQSRVTA